MSIKKSIFKIFNGTSWDEYYHKTSADQVVYTKPDGTASNVQTELAEQNSTLKSAIKFVDYQVTLDSNAYVAPFSYYANNYLPISDIEKYGTPISATLTTSSGQAHPVALNLMSNGKYHYTCVATAAKGVMTVVFLKLN